MLIIIKKSRHKTLYKLHIKESYFPKLYRHTIFALFSNLEILMNNFVPSGTSLPPISSLVWYQSCVNQLEDVTLFRVIVLEALSQFKGGNSSLFLSFSLFLSLSPLMPALLFQYMCRLWAFLLVLKNGDLCLALIHVPSATRLFSSHLKYP